MELTTVAILLVAIAPFPVHGQANQKHVEKRCTLKLLSKPPLPSRETIHFRKGEKSTGLAPLIKFEILESGRVTNARVERSSGISDIDTLALDWVRSARYNKRPGCGVVEGREGVVIDRR